MNLKDRKATRVAELRGRFTKTLIERLKTHARRHLPASTEQAFQAVSENTFRARIIGRKIKWAVSRIVPVMFAGRRDPLEMLRSTKPRKEEALRQEYSLSGLDKKSDTFVIYRVIGNDLVPRHKKGQSRNNLRFVLENEPDLPDCEKRWIVNRIFDQDEERAIIDLLEAYGQSYILVPFIAAEYRAIGWDFDALPGPGYFTGREYQALSGAEQARATAALYRLKNNYIMHNNGARNLALRDGRLRAKWILPWDGNCFVSVSAWREIRDGVKRSPHLKYFVVPMERIVDNNVLLRDDFEPYPIEEPQMIFRSDATEGFNEDFCYGRRPKVELFWRLKIPGPWRFWWDDPWDQPRRAGAREAGQFGVVGWVARLSSGVPALEQEGRASFVDRGVARNTAIISTIDHVDHLVREEPDDLHGLAFYSSLALEQAAAALRGGSKEGLATVAERIIEDAKEALTRGPYSVVDKTTLPPSADPHDYWHPAPYYWPDPNKRDGIPYISRDGLRVPGTRLYEPDSDRYDRTRLQLMFDGTTALALGWALTGREDFARHGAQLVRSWFLDPATRMNPHLRYAQVRRGHNKDLGSPSGIIELKDFYYFLDAVRLLERSGAFSENDTAALKEWMQQYLDWLETSSQGKKECSARNNHGTYFDLHTAAVNSYLGNCRKLQHIFLRAQSRISQQFTVLGEQPEEMVRSLTQHYCFFNLQGWFNILLLARAHGFCLKQTHTRLGAAFDWLLGQDLSNWPYEQIEPFDGDRLLPLALAAQRLELVALDTSGLDHVGMDFHSAKPIFHPHDAVQPYWNLNQAATADASRTTDSEARSARPDTSINRPACASR